MPPRRFSVLKTIFPAHAIQWSGPLLAAAIAAFLAAMLVSWSGIPNLSASVPHPAGWARFLHYTFKQSTAFHARGLKVPADLDTAAMIEKGAVYYSRACAHCHGGPGLGQNPVALSMRPQPQYLVRAVKEFSPAELHWIVERGVKYSAMPSWPVGDRPDEVWSLVAFIKHLPGMTADQYHRLVEGPTNDATTAMPPAPAGDKRSAGYVLGTTSPNDPTYQLTRPAIGFDGRGPESDIGQECRACHGTDGTARESGGIPNIALLTKAQIAAALNAYAAGTRHSGFMQNMAVQLTKDQIDTLSAYYGGQPKRQSASVKAPADMLALGERIATRGIPARHIGACANCHDESKAAAKAFPGIDGQYPLYLRDQLRLFREGVRGGAGAANQMRIEARGLSDHEIDALAFFYASRQPSAAIRAIPAPAVASAQRLQAFSTAK